VLGIVRGYGERSDDEMTLLALRDFFARQRIWEGWRETWRDGGGWGLTLFAFVFFGAAALLSFFFSSVCCLLLLLSSFNFDAPFATHTLDDEAKISV
jgi:hypothetical protein